MVKVFCVAMLITTTLFAQGELIDGRDGNIYKTITIGDQVWMAENLRFDNGRYTWTAAKDACPIGWHLPGPEEFQLAIESADAGKKIVLEDLAKDAKRAANHPDRKSINVRCVRDILLTDRRLLR